MIRVVIRGEADGPLLGCKWAVWQAQVSGLRPPGRRLKPPMPRAWVHEELRVENDEERMQRWDKGLLLPCEVRGLEELHSDDSDSDGSAASGKLPLRDEGQEATVVAEGDRLIHPILSRPTMWRPVKEIFLLERARLLLLDLRVTVRRPRRSNGRPVANGGLRR